MLPKIIDLFSGCGDWHSDLKKRVLILWQELN